MAEIDATELSKRLYEARTAAGLSQGALAADMDEALGIGQSFVSAVEKERAAFGDVAIGRIEALAKKLGFAVPYKTNGANGHATPEVEKEPETEEAQIMEHPFAGITDIVRGGGFSETIIGRHFGLVGPEHGIQYETKVLDGCAIALERLKPNARQRVLAYLNDLFKEE